MAFLLEPDAYASVRPLFEEMSYHLAVTTVLAGILPGRVYVDNPTNPGAAVLIPSNQHRICVSGEPSPHLLADVFDLLFKESLAESYGFVVYYDTSHPWKSTLEDVLQKQEISSGWRQLYSLRKPPSPIAQPLPEHMTIRRINEVMIEDATLGNKDLLVEEIHSESPSLEHFFRQNFGFCAQNDSQLVAWCLAEYHYQGRYELGIETLEAYQRQGIATHLATTVIRHAFDRGAVEIGWHCWATNTPSIATALKVGFEKVLDYPVCYGQYRQALV
jgi:RimJ/RimL family protein N-acetyltransferase